MGIQIVKCLCIFLLRQQYFIVQLHEVLRKRFVLIFVMRQSLFLNERQCQIKIHWRSSSLLREHVESVDRIESEFFLSELFLNLARNCTHLAVLIQVRIQAKQLDVASFIIGLQLYKFLSNGSCKFFLSDFNHDLLCLLDDPLLISGGSVDYLASADLSCDLLTL